MAARADELMRLVGTKGEGRDPPGALPLERILPPPPPGKEAESLHFPRGMSALTLAFNQKAVADILSAAPSLVLHAYANTLSGLARRMMA